MSASPPDVLAKILATKREEITAAKTARPPLAVRQAAAAAPPPRDFIAALADRSRPGHPIIAELKKASPSKGLIRADFDPAAIAKIYAAHGARCISVLTDEPFFQGRLEYLEAVRRTVRLPLLRKDFILEPYQVDEARAAGADAVLLIVAALEDRALAELDAHVRGWGMTTLVEVHDAAELERALPLKPRLLGVNNRDLRSFRTDLQVTLDLLPRAGGALVVSESGLNARADLDRLAAAGVGAFLIGEALMREADIGAKLRELAGG